MIGLFWALCLISTKFLIASVVFQVFLRMSHKRVLYLILIEYKPLNHIERGSYIRQRKS